MHVCTMYIFVLGLHVCTVALPYILKFIGLFVAFQSHNQASFETVVNYVNMSRLYFMNP